METKKPGKQGTKGSKQIVDENKTTLQFYIKMIAGGGILYFILQIVLGFLFNSSPGWGTWTLIIISIFGQIASFKFMQMMSTPKIAENGQILDSGTDLNMEGGLAEHAKDVIILCVVTEILALFWKWFWLALLLAPIRCLHLAWNTIIKPWMQAKNEQPEMDEKKQKKLERKMKRRQAY